MLIKHVAFASQQLQPAIRGQITDAVWRELIVSKIPDEYPLSDARNVVRVWSEPIGKLDLSILKAITAFDAGIKLVLAANATSRVAHYVSEVTNRRR